MKQKSLNFIVTIVLAIILSQFLPWWSVMIAGFISAVLIPLKKASVLFIPFVAILIFWAVYAFSLSSANDYILAKKIAVLLPLGGNEYLLILVTGLVGGISAGVSAIFGKQLNLLLSLKNNPTMISKLNLENILFLDIETVPEVENFKDLDTTKQELWESKSKYQRRDDYSAEEFYDRAGIWAEFGKIICISVGYFKMEGDIRTFRVTSFYGDEITILKRLQNLLISHFSQQKHLLCAHNGKEFDFPYIARRMIIHNIELPYKLNLFGKKPWEVPHLDTLELWKFGDYKTYTSLKLLTNVLGIPSPKDDIDGSEVYHVYYEENDIDRIITYCEKDTIAVAQIFLRLRGDELLHDNEIKHI